MKIVKVSYRAFPPIPRGRRVYQYNPHIYVWRDKETVLENLFNRPEGQGRGGHPYRELRRFLPAVALAVGWDPNELKFSWSQYTGCSCGCSPGFSVRRKDGSVIPFEQRRNVWIVYNEALEGSPDDPLEAVDQDEVLKKEREQKELDELAQRTRVPAVFDTEPAAEHIRLPSGLIQDIPYVPPRLARVTCMDSQDDTIHIATAPADEPITTLVAVLEAFGRVEVPTPGAIVVWPEGGLEGGSIGLTMDRVLALWRDGVLS